MYHSRIKYSKIDAVVNFRNVKTGAFHLERTDLIGFKTSHF